MPSKCPALSSGARADLALQFEAERIFHTNPGLPKGRKLCTRAQCINVAEHLRAPGVSVAAMSIEFENYELSGKAAYYVLPKPDSTATSKPLFMIGILRE